MSTGPRTIEGKATSSQNSTRHGLTAKAVVIKGENAKDYEQFHAEMVAYHEPDGPKETYFLQELIENAWRLRRAHRIEAQTFDRNTKDGAELADAFQNNAKEFDRVRRYITSIERAFYRALHELESLQAARWESEKQQELLETLRLQSERIKPTIASEEFVSQKPQSLAVAQPAAAPARTNEAPPNSRITSNSQIVRTHAA